MRKNFFVVWLALAIFSWDVKAQDAAATQIKIKKVTPKEVKALIDSSTEPTIMNFWATWCSPCIREIAWFDSIVAKNNSVVKLVLVNLDSKSGYPQLATFVKTHGYKADVLYLDVTDMNKYQSVIEPKWKGLIPASIFVNNRTRYYQFYSEQIPKQRFEMELNKLLAGRN